MYPTVKKYPGQKNIPGVIQKIINQIPGHKVIIELFAGTAAVSKFLSVGSSAKIVLVDIDKSVTEKFALPGSKVINKSSLDLLQSNIRFIELNDPETFIFVDPPYLHETRSNLSLYKHEFTNDQHLELLEKIVQLRSQVMIIHPDCDMYNQYLADWRKVQIKIRYHNKTSVENLYMNYPQPDILQSYQFLGEDCWDRQRIKRKGDRLIKKLQTLPSKEKNYLLNRIQVELLTKSNKYHD
jgi:site-specific DNA-adenine methylase